MANPSKPNSDVNKTIDEPPSDDRAHSGRSPGQAVIGQELEPGVVVDRYQLISKLGEGGFGVVYLASHKSFPNRRYALKLIRPDRNTSEEFSARFSKEIQAMGDLNHPNVVYATDAGEWNGLQYLAMDYVDGVPLNRLVSEKTPLTICDACELVRQAAIGMQHVYEKGRTHRDLKPPNLMLDKSGVVRILDLGLAKLKSDSESAGEPLTAMGQMMGTPDYMAPEQWEDSSTVDIRADIYSLGCTLFCLLTGRAPFGNGEHGSIVAKMRAHTTIAAPDVSTLRPDVPPKLAVIVQTCLEKSPGERFQAPEELAEALEGFVDSSNLSGLMASLPTETSPDQAGVSTAVEAMRSTVIPSHRKNDPQAEEVETDQLQSEKKVELQFSLTQRKQARGCVISMQMGIVTTVGFAFVTYWYGNSIIQYSKDQMNQMTGSAIVPPEIRPSPFAPSSTDPDSTVSNIKVTHFRADAHGVPERLGQIGEYGKPVQVNDFIRLNFETKEDRYISVIAFNTDGTVQLCFPEDESQPPAMTRQVEFPSEPDVYFGLTEGPGQQAFLVLTSKQPLPNFSEMRSQLEAAGWKKNTNGGVWQFDGKQVSQLFAPSVDRGTLQRMTSDEFRALCLTVEKQLLDCTVTGFAFPVE